MKAATSGKGPRRAVAVWAGEACSLADALDIEWRGELRPASPDKATSAILRLRARDSEGASTGGTAVLTLYATGSWTWGGDADAVAYAREPLERHGVMPC